MNDAIKKELNEGDYLRLANSKNLIWTGRQLPASEFDVTADTG